MLMAKNAELCGINIVRLYNNVGKHVASLLACGANEDGTVCNWDLCDPGGKVLYCGIENDLVDSFAKLLGWQEL